MLQGLRIFLICALPALLFIAGVSVCLWLCLRRRTQVSMSIGYSLLPPHFLKIWSLAGHYCNSL